MVDEAIADDELPPEDPEAAMAWLERLAARQGAPPEELPSIPATSDEELPIIPDALAWEQPVASQPEADGESEITVVETAEAVVVADLFGDEEWAEFSFTDVPEDPEEAMAWLETLAARQGAPLDELPSVLADAPATDFNDAADGPTILTDDLQTAVPLELDDSDDDSDDDIFLADFNREAELLALLADEPDEPEETEMPAEAVAIGHEWEELDLAMADLATPETAPTDDNALTSVPDELDAAMAWLEKLAARQGAPMEELPSLTSDDFPPGETVLVDDILPREEEAPAADEPITAVADLPDSSASAVILDELEDAMQWLDSLVETESTDTFATEPDLDLADALAATAAASWEPADLTAVEFTVEETPAPALPDDLAAELDWLETTLGLTAGETAVPPADLDETDISNEELQTALEQLTLLAQTSLSPHVSPTATSDILSEYPESMEAEHFEPEAPEPEIAPPDEVMPEIVMPDLVQAEADWSSIPDDPEEAMAWLERLAARQGASLDELPSLKDADEATLNQLTAVSLTLDAWPEEPESEAALPPATADTAVAELDMPENIDDALAWLERLAARQGASLDELPSITDTVEEFATPAWITADQAAAQAEAVEVEMRDEVTIGGEIVVEPAEAALAAAVPDETAELDSIEDAMAWLEKLAARQGASLDELPSVNEALTETDDLELPNWIAAQMMDSGSKQEHELAETDLDDADLFATDEESTEWVENFISGKTGPIPSDPAKATGPLDDMQFDLVEIDDSLPDWLLAEEDAAEARVTRHTDWLDALPEPDLEGWLAAEEAATLSGPVAAEPEPRPKDTGGLGATGRSTRRGTGPLKSPPVAETPEIEDELFLPDFELGLSSVHLNEEQLRGAREAMRQGNFNEAIQEYGGLVEVGEGLNTLIADLEMAANRHTDQPLIQRMLGDAYMRNGQLQKALDTYRHALDLM
jgi:tetratricopeptide (TPR) repeat protein